MITRPRSSASSSSGLRIHPKNGPADLDGEEQSALAPEPLEKPDEDVGTWATRASETEVVLSRAEPVAAELSMGGREAATVE